MAAVTREGLHEEFASLRSDVRQFHTEMKQDVQDQLRRFLDEMRDRFMPVDSPRRPDSRDFRPDSREFRPDSRERGVLAVPIRPDSKGTDRKPDSNGPERRPGSRDTRRQPHPRSKGAKGTFTSSLPSVSALRDVADLNDAEAEALRLEAVPLVGTPMSTKDRVTFASGDAGRARTPQQTTPRLAPDGMLPVPGKKVHPAPEERQDGERAALKHASTTPLNSDSAAHPGLPLAVPVANMNMGDHTINIIESGVGDPMMKSEPMGGPAKGRKPWIGEKDNESDDDMKSEDSNSKLKVDWMSLPVSPMGYPKLTPSPSAVNSWLPQTYKDSDVVVDSAGRLSKIPLARVHSGPSQDEHIPQSTFRLMLAGQVHPWTAFWKFCNSDYFDYFMGIFLVLNAVMIGVGVDVVASLRDENKTETPTWLRVVDGVFCIIFLLELIIRAIMYNRQYFTMKGRFWNCFDLLVVSFSLIDEISKLFLTGTKLQEAIDQMGILRLLRLARVLRLIRMVRLIPELKSMVYLISSSMGAFFWAVTLLLIMIYCIAVYFTELADEIVKKNLVEATAQEDLLGYYGSVGTSIFTCFQAITGGDDWRVFVEMFKQHSALSFFMNSFLFSIYIGFATMVMLNLVTGVFVEGAQRIIREDKEAEIVKNVRRLFHMTDSDQSGEVSWEEFQEQLDSTRMQTYLSAVDMDPGEAKALFKLLDTDRSGELSVDEFVDGVLRFRSPARSIDINSLKYDFHDITSVWASQFAVIDTNIRCILDMQAKLAHAYVASLPEETYLV